MSSAPRDLMWDLIRKASQLRVKIFTLDPCVLGARSVPDGWVDPATLETFWSETRDSLREIAEQTGGLSFERDQDLRETFDRISAALSR